MSTTTTATATGSTTTATTPAIDTIVDSYLYAYGESDGVRRRELIVGAFIENATMADPPVAASGYDGIDAMFAAVQAQFPGNAFRRTSVIDQHHDAARYEWELVAPDGTIGVAGTDFVRLAADGRLASVVGFFGPLGER